MSRFPTNDNWSELDIFWPGWLKCWDKSLADSIYLFLVTFVWYSGCEDFHTSCPSLPKTGWSNSGPEWTCCSLDLSFFYCPFHVWISGWLLKSLFHCVFFSEAIEISMDVKFHLVSGFQLLVVSAVLCTLLIPHWAVQFLFLAQMYAAYFQHNFFFLFQFHNLLLIIRSSLFFIVQIYRRLH